MLFTFLISFLLGWLPTASLATPPASHPNIEDEVSDYLRSHPEYTGTWNALSHLGWKFVETEELNSRKTYEIIIGSPLELNSFDELQLSDSHLAIKVNSKKRPSTNDLNTLFKLLNSKILAHPSLKEAFTLKWAAAMNRSSKIVAKNIGWPEDDIDALGTGYEKYFSKFKNDKFPVFGQEAWKIKSRTKPSKFFESLINSTETLYTSGCAVTLGVLLNLGGYLMFDQKSIYDKSFFDLYINNTTFYSSKNSFFQRPKSDNRGRINLDSPLSLAGQPAYIEAITENVANVDYFGENVIIVSTSQEGFDEFKTKGLGYYSSSYVISPDQFKKFKGISQTMIRWWQAFHKRYTSLKKKDPAKLKLKGDCPSENVPACKAIETLSEPDMALISTPFFTDTEMFGHPAGFKKLKDWVIELTTINPDTPYGLMFYDYAPIENIFPRYIEALKN